MLTGAVRRLPNAIVTSVARTTPAGYGSPYGEQPGWADIRSEELRRPMTTFDDREKGYEKKFALDQDLKFKAEARRNKLLGEWAAAKLGIAGTAVEDYVKAVRKADLAAKGDQDVFLKIRQDFDAKQVAVSDQELRAKMSDFLGEAVRQIETAAKT
jgi:hypothetical protein